MPFVLMHVACLAVMWVGVSSVALLVALIAYVVRMFAITGFYHRYFSHAASRPRASGSSFSACWAPRPCSAVRSGGRRITAITMPTPTSPRTRHSPSQRGFWCSHMGWFLPRKGFAPDLKLRQGPDAVPELRFLDRFDIVVPVLLGACMFGLGALLKRTAPDLGTTGWQMLVWGFFIITVVCYHATYTINSLSHVFGRQRYRTGDTSRNNWWLAILTLGEGWHNNHHHYPNSGQPGVLLVRNRRHASTS